MQKSSQMMPRYIILTRWDYCEPSHLDLIITCMQASLLPPQC